MESACLRQRTTPCSNTTPTQACSHPTLVPAIMQANLTRNLLKIIIIAVRQLREVFDKVGSLNRTVTLQGVNQWWCRRIVQIPSCKTMSSWSQWGASKPRVQRCSCSKRRGLWGKVSHPQVLSAGRTPYTRVILFSNSRHSSLWTTCRRRRQLSEERLLAPTARDTRQNRALLAYVRSRVSLSRLVTRRSWHPRLLTKSSNCNWFPSVAHRCPYSIRLIVRHLLGNISHLPRILKTTAELCSRKNCCNNRVRARANFWVGSLPRLTALKGVVVPGIWLRQSKLSTIEGSTTTQWR